MNGKFFYTVRMRQVAYIIGTITVNLITHKLVDEHPIRRRGFALATSVINCG